MRHHLAIIADPASRTVLRRYGACRPALLIIGGHDPLTSAAQREAFRCRPGHRVLEVAAAGHFVHADEPLQYASAVSEFVLAARGASAGRGPA